MAPVAPSLGVHNLSLGNALAVVMQEPDAFFILECRLFMYRHRHQGSILPKGVF